MSGSNIQILLILAAYTVGVMVLGLLSYKKEASISDYLMANREFKFFVLFSAVFGANISAVTLVGLPGTSYHVGWITWPYFATTWAWLSPLLFYTIGLRTYKLGKKFDVVTISELFAKRWKSKGIQWVSALFLLFYIVPYMMVGIIGGGRSFAGITGGYVPYWLGCLLVTLIVCGYVLVGGMRGAAWVNTFQTVVFLCGGLAIFLVIVYSLGGFETATNEIIEKYPELLNRSKMPWQRFFSYGIVVALAVPVFPNVFSRILTGKKPSELKKVVMIYPIAGVFLFILMSYSGMWGKIPFPELKGQASDAILAMLLNKYAPAWMAGVLGAAIFSALMSTVDSQLIAIGQIFMKDVVLPLRKDGQTKKSDVLMTRMVVLLLAAVAFFGSLAQPAGIINIIEWGFGGFACMFFPVAAALYWKRCSLTAAFISVVVSEVLSIIIPLTVPKPMLQGFLPAFVSIVCGLVVLLVLGLILPKQKDEENDDFFAAMRADKA